MPLRLKNAMPVLLTGINTGLALELTSDSHIEPSALNRRLPVIADLGTASVSDRCAHPSSVSPTLSPPRKNIVVAVAEMCA